MRAEDQSKTAKTVPEIEQAVDLMEAVKDVKLPDGRTNCVSKTSLDEANARLSGVRSKEEKLGVRSVCGPFVKTTSVKGDASLAQAKAHLAQVWCRPIDALEFLTFDGLPLESEDAWQALLKKAEPLELRLVLNRSKLGERKGSKAGAKAKPKSRSASKTRPGGEKEKKSLAGLAASSSPWRS